MSLAEALEELRALDAEAAEAPATARFLAPWARRHVAAERAAIARIRRLLQDVGRAGEDTGGHRLGPAHPTHGRARWGP